MWCYLQGVPPPEHAEDRKDKQGDADTSHECRAGEAEGARAYRKGEVKKAHAGRRGGIQVSIIAYIM